jgi:uncharacterized protein YqfA (UPF0365 family)
MSDASIVFLLMAVVLVILWMLFALGVYFFVGRPWMRATASGAPISLISVLGMRLRGSPPLLVVDAYVLLKRSGVDVSIADVEIAYIEYKTRVRSRDDLVELVKAATAKNTSVHPS